MAEFHLKWIIENDIPVPMGEDEDDILKWARWMQDHREEYRIGDEVLMGPEGEIFVSTVFLGVDHGFLSYGDRPPVLWETMVFGGPEEEDEGRLMERYTTAEDAAEGHKRMVEHVRNWRPDGEEVAR